MRRPRRGARGRAAAPGPGRHPALRRRPGALRRVASTSTTASCSPSSARTAPARPRSSTASTASTGRSTGSIPLDGAELIGKRPTRIAQPGRRPHVPEPRPVRQPRRDRQPHARPPPPHEDRLRLAARCGSGGPASEEIDNRAPRRGDHRPARAGALPLPPRRPAALRHPEAHRAGPGAGHGAAAAAARRAGGRHEPRGDRGHGPLHPRDPAPTSAWP